MAALGDGLEGSFQFLAYGDQRALADGEWQAMIEHIAVLERESREQPVLFVLDTGDIVQDGRYADQFHQLRELLRPIRGLPYLVAAGNHEVNNDGDPIARRQLATFLQGSVTADYPPGPEALHWEWSHGPLRFLTIDSNQFVYRREDEDSQAHDRRAAAEWGWLRERLAEPEGSRHTILSLHHPLLQSSSKHRQAAIELWETEIDGRPLLDLMADAGVDIVLTGHTHTYESFRFERDDGRVIWQINLSGRPRGALFGLGAWMRRANDIRGREDSWLPSHGFREQPGWTVEQIDVMVEKERNQFARFLVRPDGSVAMRIGFVGKKEPFELEWRDWTPLLGALR